ARKFFHVPHRVLARAERRKPARLRWRYRKRQQRRLLSRQRRKRLSRNTRHGRYQWWLVEVVERDQRHTRVRVTQLLRVTVLVRHAGLLAARCPECRVHRRRNAVRRTRRSVERARHPAL